VKKSIRGHRKKRKSASNIRKAETGLDNWHGFVDNSEGKGDDVPPMETPLSQLIAKDLEGANEQVKTTMTQLATQAGKMHAKKPTEGLREIRCFMRGMYQGHQLLLQRKPAKTDAPPEEQDESFVIDVHECHELLQRHLDITQDSSDDEKRMGTIATEYARHRRRLRLCLAGLNHKQSSDASAPSKKEAPPPLKPAAPAPTRPALKAAKSLHGTSDATAEQPTPEDDGVPDFEYDPPPADGQQFDLAELGIEETTAPPARGQKKAGQKP